MARVGASTSKVESASGASVPALGLKLVEIGCGEVNGMNAEGDLASRTPSWR